MMLPVIVTSTERDLKTYPGGLKRSILGLRSFLPENDSESDLARRHKRYPTGILLSIARVAGETAPLLFTAFGSPFMNLNVLKPINSLPLMIFNYATSPYPEWHTLAWGASFILIVFVLGLNLLTKVVTRRWKVQF